jgi:hypothetical protein
MENRKERTSLLFAISPPLPGGCGACLHDQPLWCRRKEEATYFWSSQWLIIDHHIRVRVAIGKLGKLSRLLDAKVYGEQKGNAPLCCSRSHHHYLGAAGPASIINWCRRKEGEGRTSRSGGCGAILIINLIIGRRKGDIPLVDSMADYQSPFDGLCRHLGANKEFPIRTTSR